jgi:hypothetical protein
MASHQPPALEFTVEPGDHEDQSVPKRLQSDFSSVEAG